MAITIACPKCAHTLKASDGLAGKKVQCPRCLAIVSIPAPKPVAVATAGGSSTARSVASPGAPSRTAAVGISADEVLGGFRGRIELPRVPLARKLVAVVILLVLLGLVLVYLAVLTGLAYVVYWLATSDFGPHIPSAAVSLAMGAIAVVLLCLLRPMIVPQQRSQRVYPLTPGHEKLLADFVGKICDQLDCPPPAVVQVECSPRLDVDRSGRTLTIGLALASGVSAEELAGLVAGELAQHRRHAASGPTNLIRAINGWLWRSVYQEDRFDQWVTRINLRPGFHLGRLVRPLRAVSFLGRAALWVPMFIGNTVAAALVRRTELDADLCAARLVGRKSFTASIERVKIVRYTWEGILAELKFLYREQRLPDSLPHELAVRLAELAPDVSAALLETVITTEAIPFDSRVSEADRVAALTAEPEGGILNCPHPAHVLWADYPKLAREVTFDYYSAIFGAQHLKAALRRVT